MGADLKCCSPWQNTRARRSCRTKSLDSPVFINSYCTPRAAPVSVCGSCEERHTYLLQANCSVAGDVEMKAVSQKKKAPPTQIVGGCLSELIDQAAAEHRAVVAKERCGPIYHPGCWPPALSSALGSSSELLVCVSLYREKKLPRGQRSKAQKSRKIDRLEKVRKHHSIKLSVPVCLSMHRIVLRSVPRAAVSVGIEYVATQAPSRAQAAHRHVALLDGTQRHASSHNI